MAVTPTSNLQDKEKIQFVQQETSHPDFVMLVDHLNKELASRDGAEHAFYDQFNSIEQLRHRIVGYQHNKVVCCGAFKVLDGEHVEIKRMYTLPEYRGNGFALELLNALEAWAVSLGIHKAVLETGKRQPEAIALYEKAGYKVIENYGPYKGVENSVCFEKRLD